MKIPLAEQLRPESLEEIAGQDHLLGKEGWLSRIVKSGRPLSILLWGPPGCGKTTIAKLYAKAFDARFISFSSVFDSISDLKKIIKENKEQPLFQKQLVVFIDEIHRLNKAQQDTFLPFIENGTIILVCATTENPSFALNNALLSRLRVLTLQCLDTQALSSILTRCEEKIKPLPLSPEAKKAMIELSQGDARHLLNMVENIVESPIEGVIDLPDLEKFVQKRAPLYDRDQEGHYNLISALHKSVRGSDPDAALYWLVRMLDGGEDPQFLARRIVRMAVEDIGLADPQALSIANHAWQAYDHLGSPEGELALAQAVIYLALAPKSNAVYVAYKHAKKISESSSHVSPPKTILNAPTKLMRNQGYGENYLYDHDEPEAFSGQDYFPEEVGRIQFYSPVERGFEREMKKRIDYFAKLRESKNK
ncbi:MAG TPA: replication-associated recombination protein A [Rhabdochlamydiaceae bacterium]|nr:replication-associated recombination protein A [Rhabdochlamydiaceae bacterium]